MNFKKNLLHTGLFYWLFVTICLSACRQSTNTQGGNPLPTVTPPPLSQMVLVPADLGWEDGYYKVKFVPLSNNNISDYYEVCMSPLGNNSRRPWATICQDVTLYDNKEVAETRYKDRLFISHGLRQAQINMLEDSSVSPHKGFSVCSTFAGMSNVSKCTVQLYYEQYYFYSSITINSKYQTDWDDWEVVLALSQERFANFVGRLEE